MLNFHVQSEFHLGNMEKVNTPLAARTLQMEENGFLILCLDPNSPSLPLSLSLTIPLSA